MTLQALTHELESMTEPYVPAAWNKAFEYLGINSDIQIIGQLFFSHVDLEDSPNKYHNHRHAAEAILSAAYLLKEEFEGEELQYNAPVLLFAMMCHDIAHTGGHNTHIYELEIKAITSLQIFAVLNPQVLKVWSNLLEPIYGSWETFFKNVSDIILSTDFDIGPSENAKNYLNSSPTDLKIFQLKMLANEADILPSVLAKTGPQRGLWLSQEQDNPKIAQWSARLFFLSQLTKYVSKASQSLGVQKHIEEQIKFIQSVTPQYLNELTEEHDLETATEYVLKSIHTPVKFGVY